MQIRVSFVSDPWQNQGREATFYTVSSMNRPLHGYRGRLAPTPTGYLHSGHGQTFWIAAERARRAGGTLVYRNEDLDLARCKPEFATAAMEDLRWLGIEWQEGPDVGGSFAPYTQSERQSVYRKAWKHLHATGMIYPSPHSRKDVAAALVAPHSDEAEPIFPAGLRPAHSECDSAAEPGDVNWRFRVPDGRRILFLDGRAGRVARTAGIDFGDFLVWRKDGFPSYELAVVADDHAMRITEVVRGEDLLTSTARQLLLYEALGWQPPDWMHCPLVLDDDGKRLAKRHAALSLRELRAAGTDPQHLTTNWTAMADCN
jgi:glutamyl-tRNA synthetase